MRHADETRVAEGYDAVYAAIPASATFQRIWRTHSLGPDYPAGFEHISFLTPGEMAWMRDQLALSAGSTLADLACGMGGPGLWIARETGARLVGVDVSKVAIAHARTRAAELGLASQAQYLEGTFSATGIEGGPVDAAMTVDALQYAPDKAAALREAARILREGGRLVVACFEVTPERVAGLPVLGTDPVDDYRPLLEAAGFDVRHYAESDGWRERVRATYQAVVDSKEPLAGELGQAATQALLAEMLLTLQFEPYRRRVLMSSVKR